MQRISYARHRFPPEIIRHAIWLYLRFTLSYRDVEELLAERGLDVSYETVRRWVLKFGPAFARNLRRLRPRPADTWHLDEMVVSIQGRRMYLWRAVDSEGEILDLLVQPRRDKAAALRLMRKLVRKQGYAPRVLVTDKLQSYGAARLWGRPARPRAVGAPRAGSAQKQSGRELASDGATTRAEDAALQVGSLRPALPLDPGSGPQYLQPSAPPALTFHASAVQSRGRPRLAGSDYGSLSAD
jgi:transposase-like protein